MSDPIYISIPKGGYVPVFTEKGNKLINDDLRTAVNNPVSSANEVLTNEKVVIAVIPFLHSHNDELENSLTDGIGLQLSNSLMQFKKYSVIAYYTMRNLCKKVTDISEMAGIAGAEYIITGNIQAFEERVRIHIQMIDTNTGKQLWGRMYESKF